MLDNGCTELGSIGMLGLIPVELPKILGRKIFGPVHVCSIVRVDGRQRTLARISTGGTCSIRGAVHTVH